MDDRNGKSLGLPEESIRKIEQENVYCRSQVSSSQSVYIIKSPKQAWSYTVWSIHGLAEILHVALTTLCVANFLNKICCKVTRDGNTERLDDTMHVNVMFLVGLLVNLHIRVQERYINPYGKKQKPVITT